ncbi:MAG: DUF3568 family protein [Phycisphaerae bacterium]|nr:DUF3568 family protein [Phycisphaerae bacterium]
MKPDPLSNLAPIVIGAVLIGLLASCAPPVLFANAGVSLAEAGTSAFVEGELRAAKKIPLDVADRAFTQALSNLRFEIERRVEGDGFVYITADQVGDDDIQVRLTSRSPAVTSIKISVGLFGNLTISRLVMEEALEVMRHWENTNDPRGMSQAGAATPSGDPTSASGTPIDPGT